MINLYEFVKSNYTDALYIKGKAHHVMTWFENKINNLLEKADPGALVLTGCDTQQWLFLLALKHQKNPGAYHQVLIFPDNASAEKTYESWSNNPLPQLKQDLSFFPGKDLGPFSSSLSMAADEQERFQTLAGLSSGERPGLIMTSMDALFEKYIPRTFFEGRVLTLAPSDVIGPEELAEKLVLLGYQSAFTVEEPFSFARKGEIFDLYSPELGPIRIYYFDEMIEEIFLIDPETQKTLRDKPLDQLRLIPGPMALVKNDEFVANFKSNIPIPPPKYKARYEKRKQVFNQISNGLIFDGFENFIPLFFKENHTLLDFLPLDTTIFHFFDPLASKQNFHGKLENLREEFETLQSDEFNEYVGPAPEYFYNYEFEKTLQSLKCISIGNIEFSLEQEKNLGQSLDLNLEPLKTKLYSRFTMTGDPLKDVKNILAYLKTELENYNQIIFTYSTDAAKQKFEFLLDENGFEAHQKSKITFMPYMLETSFIDGIGHSFILSDSDLFGAKTRKARSSKTKSNVDLFSEQISTLTEGDFVVHNKFGVGKYLGLSSMEVLGNQKMDFLILQYEGNDKVYLPVYKLNLIQKYADSQSEAKLSNLNTNKFKQIKERAKNSVKKLAFDLLKLQAKRASMKSFAFSPPDNMYRDLELAFKFVETKDQKNAIEDVIADMTSERPMDRLICGDVGFGKTEVAMRAAFKAVTDSKQVAILVPTTILALQHYESFKERFKNFPVRLDYICRFKNRAEIKKSLEDLEQGKIDVIIGTHRLLSTDVKFKDLGLVIVDEEQRFGVGHKEKLKTLKANLDFLTLSATPIPRTLQMSFLGIKNFSLIKTPPPKRQSIKTYVITDDDFTIKTAIDRELERGGQVYFVHNRVQDIEQVAARIRALVPGAKIVIGHGQLGEKELEKRILAFFKGDYQILIATTIIESGLDVPKANTMIVNRADHFGLSQLHQLRGRIGRSDKKAYAYFVLPKTRKINEVATKRLQALQTYSSLGSGFSIASSDLEIRGAGDILGPEQSGHIEAIGLELYTDLLKEAIAELKQEDYVERKDVEIQTPFMAKIPSSYVPGAPLRLKFYKKLSNCLEIDLLEDVAEELTDMFGPAPEELINFINILKVRITLQKFGLTNISLTTKKVHFRFDKDQLNKNIELRDRVVGFFMKHPKKYQLTPDYSVIHTLKNPIDLNGLVALAKDIAQQIHP